MALSEEIERLPYFCCYCHKLNSPRTGRAADTAPVAQGSNSSPLVTISGGDPNQQTTALAANAPSQTSTASETDRINPAAPAAAAAAAAVTTEQQQQVISSPVRFSAARSRSLERRTENTRERSSSSIAAQMAADETLSPDTTCIAARADTEPESEKDPDPDSDTDTDRAVANTNPNAETSTS